MNKPNITRFIKNAQMTISKHSPEILTGIGIAGMITTTVLAVKATPKAIRLLEETYGDNNGHPLPAGDVVKTCWKLYIPATVTGAVSIACLIGASNVNARRNAAIATAYKISERALTEYKDKVVETIGEKKERSIRENIDKDHIEKNPVSKSEVIITEKGNTLCYDSISGRYFKSDIDKIEKAVNEINRKMLNEMYISLNEFYDELGLNHTSLGSSLGWNIDNGLIELEFGSQISDDGTPCVVVNYSVAPKYDYSRFFM